MEVGRTAFPLFLGKSGMGIPPNKSRQSESSSKGVFTRRI